MKNKFVANIFLYKDVKNDNEFNGLFNIVELDYKDKRQDSFKIGIFLQGNIKEIKKEQFIVVIVRRNKENCSIYPLGGFEREYSEKCVDIDYFTISARDVTFMEDDMYYIEVRQCIEYTNELFEKAEYIFEQYDESELINSFAFLVKTKE